MSEKTKNIVCSVIFFLLGAFLYTESMGIKVLMSKDLGSGFFPKVVAVGLMAFSALEFVVTFLNKKFVEDEKTDRDVKGGILTILCMAAYAALYDFLGFLLASALYLFFQILILSNEKNRKIPFFAVLSVVCSAVIYGIFVYGIDVPLPTGYLSF